MKISGCAPRARSWMVAFGCALALAALAQSPAPSAGIYTCIDSKGRKLTADRPIPECMDREQKMLNPSGTVRSTVGPMLTAQERADEEARQKQAAEVRAQQVEQRRRERALLTRYPSPAVHEKERAAALAKVAIVKQAASTRVDDLLQERQKVDEELEFYKKDPSKVPPALRRRIDDIAQSIAVQKRFMGEQDGEVVRINNRFDEELQRLTPLWAAQAQTAPAASRTRKSP
ncbi:MAG: DUF4124 domain-containing protein [Burkholderiaceae bacterium]